MKTKGMMKQVLCLLTLMALLLLCGCGSDKDETPSVDSIDLSISIDYPAKAKKPDLKTLPFRAEEDSSVLQVVELFGNVNEISVLVDTTYSTLEGIDGVINDVTLKTGAWQYKINGEPSDNPIQDVILKDGDHVEFIYSKTKAAE